MNGLEQIIKENKKAGEVTKTEIVLDNHITVKPGDTDAVITITNGKRTIKFTATVLQMLLQRHGNNNGVFDVNDRILNFLQR